MEAGFILITSSVDKNVDSSKVRKVPTPAKVLGVRTVELMQAYLVKMEPPSGGYLLAAPKGRQGSVEHSQVFRHEQVGQGGLCSSIP